ncbi:MAG: GNAT family N-acetyltransferase [Alphaproteobacteria bacterium]|nr:GNAT family N-acetyltransferase [Alphaproteobacteria bacterium]
MTAAKLEKPSIEHKESYLEALKEFQEEGRYAFLDYKEIEDNFEEFIEKLNNGKRTLHKPYADWVEPVPETVLWLVKGHDFIGTLNIRHRLNWHLEKWGGHLNFVIRPSMRGKGFGKKLLQKAIPFVSYLGIDRALITIAPDDKAGNRIVEFCGAKLEDTLPATDKFPARNRYWLDCT